MSTTTTTATKKTTVKRAGAKRHPKFTAIENAIIADAGAHGVTKALAITMLRQWEAEGLKAEDVAAALRFSEKGDSTRSKKLGKDKPGDEDTYNRVFGQMMGGEGSGEQPSGEDLDDLLAAMGAEAGDVPEEDRDPFCDE